MKGVKVREGVVETVRNWVNRQVAGYTLLKPHPLPNQSDNRTVDRAIDTSQWDLVHVTSSLGSNHRPAVVDKHPNT